jgi:outer membrane lipoprotein-sorting protein
MKGTVLAAVLLTLGLWACAGGAQPAPAPDAALTVDQLLDRMEKVRLTLKSFKADVEKLRQVEALGDEEKFKGTLQFKMPRLLRLELKNVDNGKETIYIVGQKYGWIYRPQTNQAEQAELRDMREEKKSANPLEYGLARDLRELKEAYALKLLPEEQIADARAIPLEMTPLPGNAQAGKMIFWVDPATWLPARIREFKSNNEIIETHTFSNMKANASVPDKAFELPKGVDILMHDPEPAKK